MICVKKIINVERLYAQNDISQKGQCSKESRQCSLSFSQRYSPNASATSYKKLKPQVMEKERGRSGQRQQRSDQSMTLSLPVIISEGS